MKHLTLLFALLLAAAFIPILIAALRKAAKEKGDWPFYARKAMTEAEQALYFRLCKSLPEHLVLAQVGLSRILGVKKGHKVHEWNNRINRMSADFVICRKDASVLAVIELDDKSHQKADRKAADTKKDKALAAAGIKVIRWTPGNIPDEAGIRAAIIEPRLPASQSQQA